LKRTEGSAAAQKAARSRVDAIMVVQNLLFRDYYILSHTSVRLSFVHAIGND
jgi:hypothetical protein